MIIKQKPNTIETDSNFCIDNITKEEITENNFIDLDTIPAYEQMVKEVMFADDLHNKYSSNMRDNDYGAIIAYALASDSYSQYICKNNKLKLIEIKCDRKDKSMQEKIDLLYNVDTVTNSVISLKDNEEYKKENENFNFSSKHNTNTFKNPIIMSGNPSGNLNNINLIR